MVSPRPSPVTTLTLHGDTYSPVKDGCRNEASAGQVERCGGHGIEGILVEVTGHLSSKRRSHVLHRQKQRECRRFERNKLVGGWVLVVP
ncbi:hypothetical protein BaRGS_00033780 [Batillaria attramentaria]|uniref:Uncharacterized protein n=1 Tax=Batillaria attramentaria TaxID=370345 RepID=A0ABD0JJ17_9CAEN